MQIKTIILNINKPETTISINQPLKLLDMQALGAAQIAVTLVVDESQAPETCTYYVALDGATLPISGFLGTVLCGVKRCFVFSSCWA